MRLLFTNPPNAVHYGNSIVNHARCEKKIFAFVLIVTMLMSSFFAGMDDSLPYELV
jgi:hypothetical protein